MDALYYNRFDIGLALMGLGNIFQASAKSEAKTGSEALCGKQPHGVLGFKSRDKKIAIENWNKCVYNYQQGNQEIAEGYMEATRDAEEKNKNKIQSIILYSTISLAVILIIFFSILIIYKRKLKSI
ncbi:MAG: hypothetical protein WCT85_00620 [Parachlamydiales bacterium]|jgi:hypothetical protein